MRRAYAASMSNQRDDHPLLYGEPDGRSLPAVATGYDRGVRVGSVLFVTGTDVEAAAADGLITLLDEGQPGSAPEPTPTEDAGAGEAPPEPDSGGADGDEAEVDLNELKRDSLRELLAERGLPTYGTKAELIERLGGA